MLPSVYHPAILQMRRFGRKAAQYYFFSISPGSCSSISTLSQPAPNPWNHACDHSLCRPTLASPWSAIQRRGAKVMGSDVTLSPFHIPLCFGSYFMINAQFLVIFFVIGSSFLYLMLEFLYVCCLYPSSHYLLSWNTLGFGLCSLLTIE